MRARMAIKYSQTVVELREVKLSSKPQSMLNISPKGTVPVLQLPDNSVLEESIDIIHWALSRSDPQDWSLSGVNTLRNRALDLIWKNDQVFKQHLDQYKYADRYPEWPAEHYRQQGMEYLQQLERHLQHSRYLMTDHISIADISIFPFIRQFAHVDKAWFEQTDLPGLQSWLQEFIDSALFNSIMDKYPPWDNNDAVIF
jgi:glutathione S-transferase